MAVDTFDLHDTDRWQARVAAGEGRLDASADGLAKLEAGLDALGTTEDHRPRLGRRFLRTVVPPVALVGLVILAWQIAVWAEVKPPYVLPPPSDVLSALVASWEKGAIWDGVQNSLGRGIIGFAVSIAVAVPLGLLVARVSLVRAAVKPLLSGLQTLPSVAWVPAAILWFGLSDGAIYMVILLGAIPSITNGLVAGIDQVPPLFQRVGRVLGARGLVLARHVLIPAALPGFLAGLRQGWAFAWRSLMAAELIAISPALGNGLGQQMEQARTLSDVPGVIALIFVILAVGVLIELAFFAPIERRLLSRRGLEPVR